MPFTDVHQLELLIADYFRKIEEPEPPLYLHPVGEDPSMIITRVMPGDPPTLCGLILFLKYDSRATFEKLAQGKSKVATALRRARLRIEAEYEKKLHKPSPTGAIFALKNMGWADKDVAAAADRVQSLKVNVNNTGTPLAAAEREVA